MKAKSWKQSYMWHRQGSGAIGFIRLYGQHTHCLSVPISIIPQALNLYVQAAAAERCLFNTVSTCEKSCGWPRNWSASETAALTHSPDPQATVWAALSVRKHCSQGASCHNNLTALEWLKSQRRNWEFVIAVPKLHLTESWYFRTKLSKVLQSYLSDRKSKCWVATCLLIQSLGYFFNANVINVFDLTPSTED